VSAAVAAPPLPRLGFLGAGWIGRSRLEAIVASGAADVAAIADPDGRCRQAAARTAPDARLLGADLDALLDAGLDGIVIATPSALHAEQAIAALDRGVAVFCQKPLGRTAAETQAVVTAARRTGRLLGVDMSYRHTAAALALRERLDAGAIGPVHAVDLVFHNAYGPDKPWFLDPALAGGGCVVDLGVHLVDLLLWALGHPPVAGVHTRRWRDGEPAGADVAEDLCLATLDLAGGTVARLACSWFSHEGRDCVVEATFRGRDGALGLRNVGGSFYDFALELRRSTSAAEIVSPPDPWSGRAAVEWARRLRSGERFDPAVTRLVEVADVIDRVLER
jgi:predicted dehydrogenase